jgi:hypothetical protein
MARFTVVDPGNNVAAIAAYWASATERLLAFECANPQASIRVRYEDVAANAVSALANVRRFLNLEPQALQQGLATAESKIEVLDVPDRRVLDGMIPVELRERVALLEARLSYPASVGAESHVNAGD